MTLAQLRYAICVADTHSMNEASRSLFISQPSLSTSIKELENEIGLELFKRTNRGVTVTPEGEEFLGYARQVVEQYQLVEDRYIEKKDVKKKFSVSMQHYTFAVKAFVEMVKQFGRTSMSLPFMRQRPMRSSRTYGISKARSGSYISTISTGRY